ncbi:hypothetical protein OAF42_02575 [Planctomicrobium sp.]|jgi:hypothetical protein|nr:hypothetical protein [Planctomicrobium sp.]MBT5018022.1 hypothetical protein [Planctomicrobium sp.]MDA7503722.1 hypothetical protein [bacterium]MDB4733307.1 hypothetical protein [Planctomicrobium sp.]
MLVMTLDVDQSLLIEDVQLRLTSADARQIIFTMTKLSGGRETNVVMQRHQIVVVCYNVRFQMISVEGQTARLVLEPPENIQIQKL